MTDLTANKKAGHWDLLIIGIAVLIVLVAGLMSPEPMIGDEVTHYFMLKKQAEDLSTPNILADIPRADGVVERRFYPHVFLWHYLGALVCKPFAVSPASVQVYQVLFWLQLLWAARGLGRALEVRHPGVTAAILLLLASVPMCVLFSVAYYQDLPAAAQALTAFYLLHQGRYRRAAVFVGIALAIKISAVTLAPFFVLCTGFLPAALAPLQRLRRMVVASLIVLTCCAAMAAAQASIYVEYYPITLAKQLAGITDTVFSVRKDHIDEGRPGRMIKAVNLAPDRPQTAEHPGDIRRPINLILYGGVLVWVALPVACAMMRRKRLGRLEWCMLAAGVGVILMTGFMMKSSPDARFFVIGLVLILVPVAALVSHVPGARYWMVLLAIAALGQGVAVAAKAYQLRHVDRGIQEVIAYLREQPPRSNRVFMYPEGSYRLFPCDHTWYMEYRLRDFWKMDNDARLVLLKDEDVGAIVIMKKRVGVMDPGMTNLGIYPDFFVQQIASDPRFVHEFENADAVIYRVPLPVEQKTQP